MKNVSLQLSEIAGFEFIYLHFIRNIFETTLAKKTNPHKHLAHKVINKDSHTDLNMIKTLSINK